MDFDDGFVPVGRGEDSSPRLAVDVSSVGGDKGKDVVDDSGFDMDPEESRMIAEGLIQIEVRMEVSTRTITIPMDGDLLVDTGEVVPTLGPLYSNVEGETLKMITDSTLSKSIASLALRVNTIITFLFPYVLAYF